MRLRFLLPLAASVLALAGVAVLASIASARPESAPPPKAGPLPPGSADAPVPPQPPGTSCDARLTVGACGDVRAGESASVVGYTWFFELNCQSRVRLTLTDAANRTYSLGEIRPRFGDVHVDVPTGSTTKPNGGFSLAAIIADVVIPEAAAAGPGTVLAEQPWRMKLFGFCFTLNVKRYRARVEILPARFDSTVLTGVSLSPVRQGEPATLSWRLSRPGLVHVALGYRFTPKRALPLGVVLAEQRPAGANTFALPMSLQEKSLPPGDYFVRLELVEPANSGLTPALPKQLSFELRYRQ